MNFNEMTKEELIAYINSMNEDKTGKYGLVWDREKEPEQIVVECDKQIPVLKEIVDKSISGNNGKYNILIEGDNFHSLSVLNYTHKEAIDIIYIDPPYNTGSNDFMYNDRFVDLEDGYRHSKWLNFMQKRLKLARNLLKEDGVIFISIGIDEVAQLRLLCDQLFGINNFLGMVTRRTKTTSFRGNYFAPRVDYILCYSKTPGIPKFTDEVDDTQYKKIETEGVRKGEKYRDDTAFYLSTLETRPNQRYYIECPDGELVVPPGTTLLENPCDAEKVAPNKGDGVWRWECEQYKLKKDLLVFKKTKTSPLINQNGEKANWNIYTKVYLSDKQADGNIPTELLLDFINREGTRELKEYDIEFSFPKPTNLIEALIKYTNKSKNVTILDFFAGSGTTGHAVLKANHKDNGNRQFIICTNNEGGICDEVTYPRISRVINGYKKNEPLPSNLKYFKTEFVDNTNNRDQLYYDLTEKCIPMLCLKENCFEEYKTSKEYAIYKSNTEDKYACVYYDLFGQEEQKFIEELKKINSNKVIYKFSLGDYVDETIFRGVDNFTIEPIPYKIVEVYRKLVKLSKEEN